MGFYGLDILLSCTSTDNVPDKGADDLADQVVEDTPSTDLQAMLTTTFILFPWSGGVVEDAFQAKQVNTHFTTDVRHMLLPNPLSAAN